MIHYLQSLVPVPMSEGPFAVLVEPTPAWISVPSLLLFTASCSFSRACTFAVWRLAMRATNAKEKLIDQFSSQQVRTTPSVFLVSTFFVLALLLGCGPSASQGDGTGSAADPASSDMPELTDDVIRERINDVRVRQIPDENGTAEPISWRFDEEEPKEIKVVEKQVEGNRTTITLDIKTESSPRRANCDRGRGTSPVKFARNGSCGPVGCCESGK